MVHKITHVLFDLDGTLVNTIDLLIDLLREYAESQGRTLTKDIEREVANISNPEIFFNKYFDSIEIPSGQKDRQVLRHHILQSMYTKKFKLIPGVERLVKHLHQHGIHMAIATGNSSTHLGRVGEHVGPFLTGGLYFSHAVAATDDPEVIHLKPHPDVYYVCAQRFATPPESYDNILIVEDSLSGITGAVASGMKTLLINDRKLCTYDMI
ncbi:unnamed protein product [Oppiella nova]|uniref:Uncharacterized protein n=1 Tax=Oppiella nova TaxID=334625 RepID=A0A7R9MCP9_9ACAR|nr:unnamed protein product [Oppiella nova]CAG2174936.1 unnamed protein product [Oppiella nova]